MSPTQGDILSSKANPVVKTGQSRVSLLRSVGDRLRKHVADVQVVFFAKAVINAAAELIVVTLSLRIEDVIVRADIRRARNVRLREIGDDYLSHTANPVGRNDIARKSLAGGAERRIVAGRGIDDSIRRLSGVRIG